MSLLSSFASVVGPRTARWPDGDAGAVAGGLGRVGPVECADVGCGWDHLVDPVENLAGEQASGASERHV